MEWGGGKLFVRVMAFTCTYLVANGVLCQLEVHEIAASVGDLAAFRLPK